MVTKVESFEGGAAGVTLTTANTTFNAFGSTPPKFSSVLVKSGGSVRFGTNGQETAKWTGLSQSQSYLRMWIKFASMSAVNRSTLFTAYSTGSVLQAVFEVTIEGFIKIRTAGGTTVGTGTVPLALDTVYRVEWDILNSSTTQTARVYDEAGALLDTISGAASASPVTEIWVGSIQNTPGDYCADDVTLQDSPLAALDPPAVWHLVGPGSTLTPLDLRVMT